MNTKKALIFTTLALTSVMVVALVSFQELPTQAFNTKAATPYSCSSWHFGMNDNDLSGHYLNSIGSMHKVESGEELTTKGVNTIPFHTPFISGNVYTLDKGEYIYYPTYQQATKTYALYLHNGSIGFETYEPMKSVDIYCLARNRSYMSYTMSVDMLDFDISCTENGMGSELEYPITYTKYHINMEDRTYFQLHCDQELIVGDIVVKI